MIGEIFRRNKGSILATYFVLVIENAIFSFCPFLFGKAIDGLIADDPKTFRLYLGILVGGVAIGIARRMVDTRIFSKVWKKVGTETIIGLMDKDVESSKVITRAGLSSRYVDFFEYYIPQGFRDVVYICMSIVMLWIAVPHVIMWLILFAVTALTVSRCVSSQRKKYDHIIMDSVDQSNKAIQEKDKDEVIASYDSRTKNYVKSSDWDAANWGFTDMLSLAAEAIVVLALINMKESTGNIISTVAYVGMLFQNINSMGYFFVNLRSIEVADEKIGECHADQ